MSKKAPQEINGFPLVEWHRAIFRFPPKPILATAVGAGIGLVLGSGRPVRIAEWTHVAIEFGEVGFTPAEFTVLREVCRERARGIAVMHPHLVTGFPTNGIHSSAFRFHAAGWVRWLELVRLGELGPDEAVTAVLHGR